MSSGAHTPDFALADYWLTYTIDRLRRFPRDPSQPKKATGRDRYFADACYLLGLAYIEYASHNSARQAFKKAVRIDPNFADAYGQLGRLHIKKMRNPKRAEKYLSSANQLYLKHNDLHHAALIHTLREKKRAEPRRLKTG